MSEATFTIPGPILDMLLRGAKMSTPPIKHEAWKNGAGRLVEVRVWTDAGDKLTFLRAPDMVRT